MDFMIPILMIAGIHLAAVASPGPNFFISAKHGLSYSRPAGLSTTAGVATGTLIHITLGFLGLSALYFLALFTTVISASTPLPIKLTLVVLLPVISWLWYSLVAMSFSLRRFKALYSRSYGWIETAFGILLVGLGLKIALGSK